MAPPQPEAEVARIQRVVRALQVLGLLIGVPAFAAEPGEPWSLHYGWWWWAVIAAVVIGALLYFAATSGRRKHRTERES
jgi:heme/copper-type cytochrome/quinol oxidase subunit 2